MSREIIKKPSGNMTIFAFDKDQGLSEHTAPFDAFAQIIESGGKVQNAFDNDKILTLAFAYFFGIIKA